MVNKKEIADGIVKFITNDLITEISNKHTKFALCMAKKALHDNADLVDMFFDSPLVASVVKKEGDMYNVETLAKVLKNVLAEYESFSITIPKIPVFSPHESVVEINAEDVDKILSYIRGDSMVTA